LGGHATAWPLIIAADTDNHWGARSKTLAVDCFLLEGVHVDPIHASDVEAANLAPAFGFVPSAND
jgi:hypothetical protein